MQEAVVVKVNFENPLLYRQLRESELGKLSDDKLAGIIKKYKIPIVALVSGERFSNISAIIDWEITHKQQISL